VLPSKLRTETSKIANRAPKIEIKAPPVLGLDALYLKDEMEGESNEL